ncbi:DEAD/DEAH box helicase [Lactobacillus sp. YT155]|uniref:DUF3427 domain-containing protein n=1 Tax=Lactobacillus sp. YT155 TaxID=3060955 RepID=UPI00265E3C2F|nr:DEAD/DEAH box helicase [Lactobacillus sp. YT155]MDO1604950.1 DEAD/DEAH box helicase [Lactobacillus sp. YT155]
MEISKYLSESLMAGFVDKEKYSAQTEFAPKLLTNSKSEKVKFHLEEELATCLGFTFAVAFISEAILTDLKVKFADLAAKGIRGRIITSTYLGFNNPKVFKELLKIPNVDVRVLPQNVDFHAKGYIFQKENYQTFIIGSSNLSSTALIKNYEWNLKLTSLENSDLTNQLSQQIEQQWEAATPLTEKWIAEYSKYYVKPTVAASFVEEQDANYSTIDLIKPNKMQIDALSSIQNLRDQGKNKALIISATGTGKTYLGAFDVKQASPNKFLFVVHREQILNKALESFYRVIGGSRSEYGILSGNQKDTNKKYLFTTIQTISKDETLSQFAKDEFDYIMIDEAHKSGAKSYRKIIDYFAPKFMLGMTATPERTDDFNIYELFDYNIAYEIRLQDAIEEDMLSQFHYIGVTDYEYEGKVIDDNSGLKELVSEERIDYVEQQIDYYGHAGEQTSGLIFCSRKEEAHEIAEIMTQRGHKSVALTGEDSINYREEVVAQFENGKFDYIVTVDIFNEGIDIPQINQIVMLRNTQSSIIFIQQLGRGLRKYKNKDFVTIIDFIGNYKNNYLIPVALSGDKSRNKNSLRSGLITNQLIGLSSINFSEIAKQRIYESINNISLTQLSQLRDEYLDLKHKLGKIPELADFLKWGSIDPQVIVDKYENYYEFLLKMKETVNLSKTEQAFLSFVSKELMNGKRIHELKLLEQLLKSNGKIKKSTFLTELENLGTYIDNKTVTSFERVLNLQYFQEKDQVKYGDVEYVTLSGNDYQLDKDFFENYESSSTFRQLVADVINVGLEKNQQYDLTNKFTLGKKYDRKDANRLLGWENEQASAIYGYTIKDDTCPIFVKYKKPENTIDYDNIFYNTNTIKWFTRPSRRLDSPEVRKLIDGDKNKTLDIYVFLKKNDDEGSDFYCLGQADIEDNSIEQTTMQVKGVDKDIVAMNLKLREAMEYSLYLNIIGS